MPAELNKMTRTAIRDEIRNWGGVPAQPRECSSAAMRRQMDFRLLANLRRLATYSSALCVLVEKVEKVIIGVHRVVGDAGWNEVAEQVNLFDGVDGFDGVSCRQFYEYGVHRGDEGYKAMARLSTNDRFKLTDPNGLGRRAVRLYCW